MARNINACCGGGFVNSLIGARVRWQDLARNYRNTQGAVDGMTAFGRLIARTHLGRLGTSIHVLDFVAGCNHRKTRVRRLVR